MTPLSRWGDRLAQPVDAASLGVFRALFGAILTWQVVRYFTSGWIDEYYVEPAFHFPYFGFEWVRPWPADGMQLHFAVLGVLALGLTVGVASRACALLFALGFGWVFLLEKGRYLNHFYLVILLVALVAAVPAGRAFSWSCWRAGWPASGRRADGATRAVPAWTLALLRTQLGLVYLHAGIAKLNPDWLAGEPLRAWLSARAEHAVLGPALTHEWAPWVFSYGGLAIDLFAWPLLAMRRTRTPAALILVSFHLTNAALFGIGIFPWLMIATTTLFYEPDWPRRLVDHFRARGGPAVASGGGARRLVDAGRTRGAVLALAALYLAFQALFPLRHLLYPGSVHWTEEGHAFAWHMKLRDKEGEARFLVTDVDTGETWVVHPAAELTPWQARKVAAWPDMVLQYAHHLAETARRDGHRAVEVRATVMTSLNGRRRQPLVDPSVDLAAERWGLGPSRWIVPLTEPLHPDR